MFIWNGISSDEMSVKAISLPPISLSEENIEETEVEGRDGSLTKFKGYKATTRSIEADYFGNNPYEICDWLRGNGEVIFGNDEDFYYKARVNNQISLEEIIEKYQHNFLVQLRCQPFKYYINGKKKKTITMSGTLLNNLGNKEALPIITVYGTGNITININGRAFTISNLSDSITIISEIQEVFNNKGDLMDGEFPYFDKGKNIISWSGNVTKIEIIPNWRCL